MDGISEVSVVLTLDEDAAEEVLQLLGLGTKPEDDEVCGIHVDEDAHRAYVDGLELDLTPREFRLLALLAEGRAITYEKALERVWGDYSHTSRKMVSNCVSRLRAKLGEGRIECLRGYGYRLC